MGPLDVIDMLDGFQPGDLVTHEYPEEKVSGDYVLVLSCTFRPASTDRAYYRVLTSRGQVQVMKMLWHDSPCLRMTH